MKRIFRFEGIGLFSGSQVSVEVVPDEMGGIRFQRTDMPGHPIIQARTEFVKPGDRRTVLSNGSVQVEMTEHLLAALFLLGVDHALVRVDGPELPMLDGSALEYYEQMRPLRVNSCPWTTLTESVYDHENRGEKFFEIHPADRFEISYGLALPNGFRQEAVFTWGNDPKNILAARTFSLASEWGHVSTLPGMSLHSGFLIADAEMKPDVPEVCEYRCGNQKLFSVEPPRFENEGARHKLLDLIGDFALLGFRPLCKIHAIGTGHAENHRIAMKLKSLMLQAVS